MEPRRIVTTTQAMALVSFLEEHGELLLGKDRTVGGRALSRKLWDECAATVNREGDPRNGKDWAKYWCELKCRVKTKIAGGGKPAIPLTALEERVAVFVRQNNVGTDTLNQEKEKQKDETADETELEEEAPHDSPPPSPTQPAEPSPRVSSPRYLAANNRPQVTATRATQYSPSTLLSSLFARSEERHARIEERRARLEERRARLEERQARNDQLLAEAVLQRADAAVVQAEAARIQAQALTNISQALQQFVDVASNFLAQPRY